MIFGLLGHPPSFCVISTRDPDLELLPFPTTHGRQQNNFEQSDNTMLIQETHKDVATKADGKEGSMSIFTCHMSRTAA